MTASYCKVQFERFISTICDCTQSGGQVKRILRCVQSAHVHVLVIFQVQGAVVVHWQRHEIVKLQSWVRIQQSPQPTVDCCPEMGCHLGWHFAVGCPLRGGRGEYEQQGLLHQKQLRKKFGPGLHNCLLQNRKA